MRSKCIVPFREASEVVTQCKLSKFRRALSLRPLVSYDTTTGATCDPVVCIGPEYPLPQRPRSLLVVASL